MRGAQLLRPGSVTSRRAGSTAMRLVGRRGASGTMDQAQAASPDVAKINPKEVAA